MLDCLYQVVKEFQTIIVGVLGFSGVIFTLQMTSRLSREQHERSVKHDREVLNCAARGTGINSKGHFPIRLHHPKIAAKKVMHSFQRKRTQRSIKALLENLVSCLRKRYRQLLRHTLLIEETQHRLQAASSGHDPSYDKPGYIFIKAPHSKTAAEIYKSFLPSIEAALQKFRNN